MVATMHVFASTCMCSQRHTKSYKRHKLQFQIASWAALSPSPVVLCRHFHHFLCCHCPVQHYRGRACRLGSCRPLVVCLLGGRRHYCPVCGAESYEQQPMYRERRG